eukprot:3612537-Prymnesium_polylepis.1
MSSTISTARGRAAPSALVGPALQDAMQAHVARVSLRCLPMIWSPKSNEKFRSGLSLAATRLQMGTLLSVDRWRWRRAATAVFPSRAE